MQIREALPLTSLAPPSAVPGGGILFSAVEIYKVSFKNQVTLSRDLSHCVSKGSNEYDPPKLRKAMPSVRTCLELGRVRQG